MFSSSQKIKKLISILIIISIISSGLFLPNTKKAEAIVPVIDKLGGALSAVGNALSSAGNYIVEQTIGGTGILMITPAKAGKWVMKMVLRQLTLSIVNWINSGFEGNPSFITDTGQFLQNTADIAIGDMLMNDPSLSFLCGPFELQLKLALGLQYSPFSNQIGCTFTSAMGNVTDAMNKFTNGDFINGGGWDSWLQITTNPQNNPQGAMVIAQAELDRRINSSVAKVTLEANWGSGFLSFKHCTNSTTGETTTSLGSPDSNNVNVVDRNGNTTVAMNGPSNTTCTVQTPGQEIVGQLGWAQSSTIREMELVDDLDAIFGALANMAIKTGASYFTSMISGGGGSSQSSINNNYLNDLQTQIDNQMNIPNTLSYGTSGNLNFNRSINSATTKQFALDTINSQIAVELQYFNVQKTSVFKLLDGAQNAFTLSNSISCTPTIKSEIINQITGSSTARDLSWNKKDLNDALTQTNNNIAALSTVRDMVATNTDDLAIPSLVQSLTTLTTLHTTAMTMSYYSGGSAFAPIQNWIIWKTEACSIPSDTLTLMGII